LNLVGHVRFLFDVWILQKETDLARSFKRINKMGRLPFHSLRSFHYERPIFPLLLKQLLQKQRYTTNARICSVFAVVRNTKLMIPA
jgi:hypothetical protein